MIAVSSILVAPAFFTAALAFNSSFDVKPFRVDLSSEIPRLNALVKNTRLPTTALYPDAGSDKGIELDILRELQTEWLGSPTFDWETQQAELNQFDHYTATIETQTVHFIHQKSADPDAIPVILLHGWPGSFHEFTPVIKPLTQSSTSTTGKNISYNVVVPSLPGFVFSSTPPANWTIDDIARIFNTLMTEVLGYPTYALHGTDWVHPSSLRPPALMCLLHPGSVVGYSLYSAFNTTARAAHFVFLPFFPPSAQQIAADNITLSAVQNVTEQRTIDFVNDGMSYLTEQTTKPNDTGLALYDNPVGQLAWIAGKVKLCPYCLWSDPRAGTPPSVLNNTAILTSISLYYLTNSSLSSVWTYAQNPNGVRSVYSKALTDAPMLFSQFEYNVGLWPQEYVAQVGNLVSYKVHDFGGHFPGLDNPPALIEDIREMGLYFHA